jgi:hypothetical protein
VAKCFNLGRSVLPLVMKVRFALGFENCSDELEHQTMEAGYMYVYIQRRAHTHVHVCNVQISRIPAQELPSSSIVLFTVSQRPVRRFDIRVWHY